MKFSDTQLTGVMLVSQVLRSDERGFFSRIFCEEEFQEAGIPFKVVQANRSYSTTKLTLRGLHFQKNESAEDKFIRVVHGSIWDVAVDVRPNSQSYLKYIGIELCSEKPEGIYIPKGFAHGFITLKPDTEVEYLVSSPYSPSNECGLRWDDPKIQINWPGIPNQISEKDATWPLL